ncbi:prepilin-type N-terminal cleavage/methylation domain-containing protein [Vibrio sp. 404]|uniref:Prepilin-type N-terminal cleavage/methylation domain-containing protein n=1 Tax=Vibrio marinisediminis TaxID=2758441 RepID=A0A7W2FPY9_9VIBR|nr:prepilin-type N-terminal cleavage/methylation domain-containing protein [Vibrio marinisediminis]MBA5762108.1 prepilin-type N-terminal cleavage/methylation domain-containing protein [Vibrio marinisediminis]
MIIRKRLGFTLVELIVVIIILTIISLYAASRYIGVGSFSALAIQDSVVAVARQVQLNRMQSNIIDSDDPSSNGNFVLSISANCIGSVKGCASPEGRSDWVADDEVTFSVAPNITTVAFDLLGSPQGAAANGVTIKIHGSNSQAQVSICPNGFISKSGCL